jgi:hypothetical protein
MMILSPLSLSTDLRRVEVESESSDERRPHDLWDLPDLPVRVELVSDERASVSPAYRLRRR